MKKNKILALVLVVSILACNQDDDIINTTNLDGIYTETSPVEGRATLHFIDENRVVKSEAQNPTTDTFFYEIEGNTIVLTPQFNPDLSTEFEITIISESEFEIENLYVGIPEEETIYMRFKK
ncbi:hypothetical protein [Haloflavibacter putidus]|uniref:Lipocalin-like domain-containing protein n=1 Tax=Haloflavibacter putidus TaxID=2576776 RepID=A0A507ZD39_9FLAO|nr:hypothetical protein [Haloflavibacter putidus]TQD33984.1 hypothetical protein FKR84_12230 [Haloflavibacter putidus]